VPEHVDIRQDYLLSIGSTADYDDGPTFDKILPNGADMTVTATSNYAENQWLVYFTFS
jgi:hypothetical protein